MGNTEWGSPIPLLLVLQPLSIYSPEPLTQGTHNFSKAGHMPPPHSVLFTQQFTTQCSWSHSCGKQPQFPPLLVEIQSPLPIKWSGPISWCSVSAAGKKKNWALVPADGQKPLYLFRRIWIIIIWDV